MRKLDDFKTDCESHDHLGPGQTPNFTRDELNCNLSGISVCFRRMESVGRSNLTLNNSVDSHVELNMNLTCSVSHFSSSHAKFDV